MSDDTPRRKIKLIKWDWRDDGLPSQVTYIMSGDDTETAYLTLALHRKQRTQAAEAAVHATLKGHVN